MLIAERASLRMRQEPISMENIALMETPPPPVADYAQAQQDRAMALGISFNGVQFVYQEFKYDKLTDAMAYAEHDVSQSGLKSTTHGPTEWLERPVPSAADKVLMQQYGIRFEGWRYHYQDYHYDHLMDAVNYARHQEAKP